MGNNKREVTDTLQAVQACQENFLNVQFEMDINSGKSGGVIVRSSPFQEYRGNDLIDAVNRYLQENPRGDM